MDEYDFTEDELKILKTIPKTGLTYQRYITVMNFDDSESGETIKAYRDDEWELLSSEVKQEWDDYVYHFAIDKEHAISEHGARVQLYREMGNARLPSLHTY